MAGPRGDIAVAKQRPLVDVGIKLRLAGGVVEIARPAHEIRYRARRAIAVERLDDEAIGRDVLRDPGKGRGGGLRQQAARRFVAVDRPADEIVRTGIAHLDDQPRHDGRGVDEGGGPLLCQRGLRAEGGATKTRQSFSMSTPHSYCGGHSETHWPSSVLRESTIIIPAICALVRTVAE